jgi:hypothetical protein
MRRPIHERLDAYEVSRKLAVELYLVTAKFPAEERYGLVSNPTCRNLDPCKYCRGGGSTLKEGIRTLSLTSCGSATELRSC